MYGGCFLLTRFSKSLDVSKKIGRAIFYKTRGWAVEKVIRVFEGSRVDQKLQRQFEKLGCVSVLSHRPSCRNQPRYQTEFVSNNVTIKNSKEEKVLGIIFNNKLDFSTHLTSITKKANIELYVLNRVEKYKTPEQKNFLTSSFIKYQFLLMKYFRLIHQDYVSNFIALFFNANGKSIRWHCLEFFMILIEVYKYVNGLSQSLYISELRKNIYNLTNAHLFESQNPRTKRYGLDCIAYNASQILQSFPIKIKRLNFAKDFQT